MLTDSSSDEERDWRVKDCTRTAAEASESTRNHNGPRDNVCKHLFHMSLSKKHLCMQPTESCNRIDNDDVHMWAERSNEDL